MHCSIHAFEKPPGREVITTRADMRTSIFVSETLSSLNESVPEPSVSKRSNASRSSCICHSGIPGRACTGPPFFVDGGIVALL